MRVFAYEYLCASAGRPDLVALQTEGWAMLRAVLADLARCPGVDAVILLDPTRFDLVNAARSASEGLDGPALALRAGLTNAARSASEGRWFPRWRFGLGCEEDDFRALVRTADFTLVIAPECDGLLAERCRWVEEEGGRLLGPDAAAVRLTGDKLALADHLRARGVPTPPTVHFPDLPGPFPLVCKPRHGAGSQDTCLIRDAGALAACAGTDRIIQPFVPGRAASVCFLAGPRHTLALPAAWQDLSDDGRFHYRGGRLPLPPDLARRAQRLAEQAVQAVPGLAGFFGVDLVLGEEADGSGDQVVEINPRLTTSYVGLRALARGNLMEALLAVVQGAAPPELGWHSGEVRFGADGTTRRVTMRSSRSTRREP